MFTVTYWSTCRTCGDELIVTNSGQETHPSCPDSSLESLQAEFVDAVNAEDDAAVERIEQSLEALAHIRPKLAGSALAYAALGWPVFPCKPGDKTPATRHGFKDATTDPDTIRAWWQKSPRANIGLATGHAFDVIDIDMPKGTLPWADLRDSGIVSDIHAVALTPRGQHCYILPTGDGNSADLVPGVDYRGLGGYVIAPPSVRPDGGRYSWSMRPSPRLTIAAGNVGAA